MEQDKKQNIPPQPAKEKPPNLVQKALRILAYPLAAVTAYFYGDKASREEIMQFYEDRHAFNHLKRDIDTQFTGALPQNGKKKKLVGQLGEAYYNEVKAILREDGFKNPFDFFRNLTKRQKAGALVEAGAAASITLGLLLTLSDNKNFLSGIGRKHSEQLTSPNQDNQQPAPEHIKRITGHSKNGYMASVKQEREQPKEHQL